MRKAILFFSLILFGLNLSAQEFFSATAATADEAAHLRFMKMNKKEYEKRSAIWKVPATVVRVIASTQSGAGYLSGHNYGAVLPASGITKYSKFSKTDDFDLVACSKPSRGIELIALALNIMNSNTGGSLNTEEDFLQHVFGAGGELALMASEAEIAYRAFTKKDIALDSGYTAPTQGSSYSNNTPVQTIAPVVPSTNVVTETAPSITEYSNVEAVKETMPTPDVPSLMINDKVVESVKETVSDMSVEGTESFEDESFGAESSESFEAAPVATEMSEEVKVNGIIMRKQETTGELDANGRRIIKDPADNINKIESYENSAAGSKIVRKEEIKDEEKKSSIASQEVDESVIVNQKTETNKKLEATNQKQTELKMAAQTEAERREAEILKAEQMIIQQRKEMAERRAKKAAAAEAAKANGGGN